jgi:hypothetical protein
MTVNYIKKVSPFIGIGIVVKRLTPMPASRRQLTVCNDLHIAVLCVFCNWTFLFLFRCLPDLSGCDKRSSTLLHSLDGAPSYYLLSFTSPSCVFHYHS